MYWLWLYLYITVPNLCIFQNPKMGHSCYIMTHNHTFHHKDCDCSNTALYYIILHCPQWLTQAELPYTLVRNDSFESKSGKIRDELSLWMCPSPWSSSTTSIHRCYAVLLCAVAAVSAFPVLPPPHSLEAPKPITTERWVLSIPQGWGLACKGVSSVRLTGVVFLWVKGHIK